MKIAEFGGWRSAPIPNDFAVRKDGSLLQHARQQVLQVPVSSRKRQNGSLSHAKVCVKAALRAHSQSWLGCHREKRVSWGRQLSGSPSWSGIWRLCGQL